MVTEKDMARYQAQIDQWIVELEEAQAQAQADILALEEKIKLEEEARAAQTKGDNQYTKSLPAQKSESLNNSKEQAKKIAEKAGVSPRKCYSYFEFERLHLRRSRF